MMPQIQAGDTIEIRRRADIAEAIARMIQAGEGFRVPLVRAAAEGALSLVATQGGKPIPARYLKLTRPTVVVLADDHPDAAGPGRWPQARKLLRWANVTILHATGGSAEHYAMIAASTVVMRKVLLIEMQQCHHAAWCALAEQHRPRLKILSLVPPPGDCHPHCGAPAGEAVH